MPDTESQYGGPRHDTLVLPLLLLLLLLLL
jgi:hypothetical protein